MKNTHFHTDFHTDFYTEAFVALASRQIAQQVAFYSQLFNITPKLNTPAYAEFQLNGLRLAIFTPSNSTTEFAATTGSPESLCLMSLCPMSLCIEVSDLESAIAKLQTLGHTPPGDIMHTSHGQEIYAYDPDGNRLILHQSPSPT